MAVRKIPARFEHICDLSGRIEDSPSDRRPPGWTRVMLQCDGTEEVYIINRAVSVKLRAKLAELKEAVKQEAQS